MQPDSLEEIKLKWHGNYKSYLIGFLLSLFLTAASFTLAAFRDHFQTIAPLVYILASLAVVQAVVQLLFFLHLGQEAKPRWETMMFLFMVVVLLIIGIGSLWIMYDLDQRVMSGMSDML